MSTKNVQGLAILVGLLLCYLFFRPQGPPDFLAPLSSVMFFAGPIFLGVVIGSLMLSESSTNKASRPALKTVKIEPPPPPGGRSTPPSVEPDFAGVQRVEPSFVTREKADHDKPGSLTSSAFVYQDRVWLVGQRTLWSYDKRGRDRAAVSLPLPGFKPFCPLGGDEILWLNRETQALAIGKPGDKCWRPIKGTGPGTLRAVGRVDGRLVTLWRQSESVDPGGDASCFDREWEEIRELDLKAARLLIPRDPSFGGALVNGQWRHASTVLLSPESRISLCSPEFLRVGAPYIPRVPLEPAHLPRGPIRLHESGGLGIDAARLAAYPSGFQKGWTGVISTPQCLALGFDATSLHLAFWEHSDLRLVLCPGCGRDIHIRHFQCYCGVATPDNGIRPRVGS